jgi:DNA-binding GntR family transcriptional regulator
MIPTLLSRMNARVTLMRRVSLASAARWPASLAEIRAVLEAIERRDPVAAHDLSLAHVEAAAAVALAALANTADDPGEAG